MGAIYGSTASGITSLAYGNPSLIPLVGGSGGSGSPNGAVGGGGAGGGAILIATRGTLNISGTITARGGTGWPAHDWRVSSSGGGSGGAIRLIATELAGAGVVSALGTDGEFPGSFGRTRIERVVNNNSITMTPDASIVAIFDEASATLWPPIGAPEVRVLSIGAVNTPTDPRAEFGTFGADVALPITASTRVLVETKNVEQASQVKVRGTPRSNGNFTEVVATVDTIVNNNPLVIRWKADLPVNVGYSAVQARVIRP